MVELIQIVDGTTVGSHRCNARLHHVFGFLHRNRTGVVYVAEDGARFLDYAVIVFDEGVATVEDRGYGLIVLTELVFVLDVDDRDVQESQARDMCLGQQCIFRQDHNHVGIDDGAG